MIFLFFSWETPSDSLKNTCSATAVSPESSRVQLVVMLFIWLIICLFPQRDTERDKEHDWQTQTRLENCLGIFHDFILIILNCPLTIFNYHYLQKWKLLCQKKARFGECFRPSLKNNFSCVRDTHLLSIIATY